MTEKLTFDGDVVVVTGGAGGLGRSQCLELARRGARVVVNDLGGHPTGGGADPGLAQGVVDEITALGGEAVACTDSVASDEGPSRIVAAALDAFGRLDGYVANAAIVRNARFEDITDDDYDRLMSVNLRGVFRGLREAYTAMKAAGGGRIVVMTSTSGLAGAFGQANYAASKTGLIGLIKTIAWEGEESGIKANLVAPGAQDTRATEATVAAGNAAYTDRPERLKADIVGGVPSGLITAAKVTPLVLRLLHRDCPVTAQTYAANGGLYHRVAVGRGEVVALPGDVTVEDVVEHWAQIHGEELSPGEIDDEALVWGLRTYGPSFEKLLTG
jgi:NAD(P)-dependent dehydrogenase (short-subunit alcohol dehydrogenase family)